MVKRYVRNTVYGRNPASGQVVDPMMYRVLAPSQVVSRISSINGISLLSVHPFVAQLAQLTGRPSLLHCYVKHQP